MKIKLTALSLFVCAFFAPSVFAQENPNTWTGGGTRWDVNSSWTNGTPDASSDVIFGGSTDRYVFVYGPTTEWANGPDTYEINSLTIGGISRAYIGLDYSISAFTIKNDLVANALAGDWVAITSWNAQNWWLHEDDPPRDTTIFNSADLVIGGNVYANSGTLFLGSSSTNIAPYNVLEDISVGGNVYVADGARMTVISQTFTANGTTSVGDGARLAGYSHIALNGAVAMNNGTILLAGKPDSAYPPFDVDYGSLYFGAGVNGTGAIANQVVGSKTTFKNELSSSSFTGNVTANLISIEGGKTQTIHGSISHSGGVNILIKDGSELVTSSAAKIDSLANEGANASFGNNAGGRNYQDINVGELRVADGTKFTFKFDLGASDLQSDKLIADVLYFQEEMLAFHFSGGMIGTYEVGEFGAMDGWDFTGDADALFSWTSDNGKLEGYFLWDDKTLLFTVTNVPEPSTCAAIFGAFALAFAAYARKSKSKRV